MILVDKSLSIYLLHQINMVLTVSSVSAPLSFGLVEGTHPYVWLWKMGYRRNH